MKKIVVLMLFFLASTISVFSADIRFVQVDGIFFNATDKTSVSKLQKMVDDINKQKNVEFVIFSGNNIARASQKNLEEFVKIGLGVGFVTKEFVAKDLADGELFEVKTTPKLNEKKFGIILLKDSMHSFGTNQLVKLLVEKK